MLIMPRCIINHFSHTLPHTPIPSHHTAPTPRHCYPVPCLACSSQAQWRLYQWRSREGVGRCGLSAGGGAITVILHHSVNCCPDRPLASGHLALTPAVAFGVKKEKGEASQAAARAGMCTHTHACKHPQGHTCRQV